MSELTPWRIAPTLGVRDVSEATDYYTKVLGFECPGGVFEGVGPGEGGVYAIVRRGDVEIHLQIRRRDVFAGSRESIEGDAYIFVPDVDGLFDEFESKGVKIHRQPEDAPYGLRDFVIEDPEGHRLTFGSPIA
jgi:uncharacterized glyoxalase superfamily protein PhnB